MSVPERYDAAAAWERLIGRLETADAVFARRSWRRLSAPLLDARREALGREAVWAREGE